MGGTTSTNLHSLPADELLWLCYSRDKATDFKLERVFYINTDGKSQPRFRIGTLKHDSSISVWMALRNYCGPVTNGRKKPFDVIFYQRTPGSGCDAREGREECNWKRCSSHQVDFHHQGISLMWTSTCWYSVASRHHEVYGDLKDFFYGYLLHLCKINMDQDLWDDITDALKRHVDPRGRPWRKRLVQRAFRALHPQLLSAEQIWNAYNHDNADLHMHDPIVNLTVKRAYETLYRGCAPPVRLLENMLYAKWNYGHQTCDRSPMFIKWRRRERRRLREGQESYQRICI